MGCTHYFCNFMFIAQSPLYIRTKCLASFDADPNHFAFKKQIVAHFLTGSSFSSRGSNL